MNVPGRVLQVLRTLHKNGFQAYVVGGSVRDSLLKLDPKDWDIATNARPDDVERIFDHTVPTGKKHGTITVVFDSVPKMNIEVTTFRADGNYSDGRRPDFVEFSDTIFDDLSRRDFTINAIAWNPFDGYVDPFGGINDLSSSRLMAVGDPDERFKEDALRMMRLIRFVCVLPGKWNIDYETMDAVRVNSKLIYNVSNERIRDELSKILLSDKPHEGLISLSSLGLLMHILPEIDRLEEVNQSKKWHDYNVFMHTMGVVKNVRSYLPLRLAALFHDAGKAVTRIEDETGVHFYGHEQASSKILIESLTRLRFPSTVIDEASCLVLNHMFQFDNSKNKKKTMRRIIAAIQDKADIYDLIELRKADRSKDARGTRFEDYSVDHIIEVADEVLKEKPPLRPSDMTIDGKDVMEVCGIGPGPIVGEILSRLFKSILSDPTMNNRDYLLRRAKGEYKYIVGE